MFSFLDDIAAHWVFIGSALIINALVATTKRVAKLFSPSDHVYSVIAHAAPIVFGIAIAAIPGLAVKGFDGFGARAFFFVAVGLASSWLYKALRIYAKRNGYGGVFESERPR